MIYVVQFFIEAYLLVIYPLCGVLGYGIKLRPTKHCGEISPVLILNPWISHNVIYVFLKRYLEKNGYTVHVLDYGMKIRDFEKAGKLLSEYIENNKLRNVILIGCSNTAITCLVYLQNHNGWKNTKKFISLGGSFYGTPLAYFLPFFKARQQIVPNSPFLIRLLTGKLIRKKMICLSAHHDELVPSWSSRIRGIRHVVVPAFGHDYFHLFSRTTYKLLLKYISH